MTRSTSPVKTRKITTRRSKASTLPKPEWIGYLPDEDPFHQQVLGCFASAGFAPVWIGINRDLSTATFRLRQGTCPPFSSRKQAYAALLHLLRSGDVKVRPNDLVVDVEGDSITGAFTPPQHRIPLFG